MRINVLALDKVFDLGLSAVIDAFQTANELISLSSFDITPFDVRIIGMRKQLRTSHGLPVLIHPTPHRRPDCVVVPAIGASHPWHTFKPFVSNMQCICCGQPMRARTR